MKGDVWQCSKAFLDLLLDMAEGDESAKLWKVNRTIHELVKDRVSLYALLSVKATSHYS